MRKSALAFARKVDIHSFFERSEIMMTQEEIEKWQKEEPRRKVVSLAKDIVVLGIKVFVVLIVICIILTLLLTLMSKAELDPVKDIDNILWWFLKVPVAICIPYYFLLKRICRVVKYVGMEKEDREFYWNLFQYLIVLPIILILVMKIVFMMVSPTSYPLWEHYQPIWDSITRKHYQQICADWINYHYEDKREFIPSIIITLPYSLGILVSLLYIPWRKQRKKRHS